MAFLRIVRCCQPCGHKENWLSDGTYLWVLVGKQEYSSWMKDMPSLNIRPPLHRSTIIRFRKMASNTYLGHTKGARFHQLPTSGRAQWKWIDEAFTTKDFELVVNRQKRLFEIGKRSD